MNPLLEDAFGHHVWATLRLLDTCLALPPEQLGTGVPGTYGSILETARHLVGADATYLFVTGGERTPLIDADRMDLAELRAQMESHAAAWSRILGGDLDRDAVLVRRRDDGSQTTGHRRLGLRTRRRSRRRGPADVLTTRLRVRSGAVGQVLLAPTALVILAWWIASR